MEDGFSLDGFTFSDGLFPKPKENRKNKEKGTFSAFDNDDHEDELKVMPVNIGVMSPKFNRKGDYRWLSIRTWDATEKEQVKWLKRVKASQKPEELEMVASEFEEVIRHLIWKTDCCFICNAPQGHSQTEKHFISEVGKLLAEKLNCEYVKMFADRHLKGSSAAVMQDRGIIEIIGHSDKPVCIFIDDVSTSGMTIINCIRALRDKYTLIPIVWIYGRKKS